MLQQDYVVETERVVNQEMLTNELKCQICHGVLMNPMECNTCENCFCMNCLQKWLKEAGKCPMKCDGDLDFKMKAHKVIRNMLTALSVTCRNQENGCRQILDYDKLEIHEEVECPFEIYYCPERWNGCKAKMRRGQIERHLHEECDFVQKECMYCSKKFAKQQLRDHLQECQAATLSCPHCKDQFPKSKHTIHVSTQCPENYIDCGRCQASFKRKYKDYHDCVRHLQNQQKTMLEQMKAMRKEIESKDAKVEELQQHFQTELLKITLAVSQSQLASQESRQSSM